MAELTLEIKGLDAMREKLRSLSPKLERQIERRALRAGARVLQDEIERLAPVRSGDLVRNVTTRTSVRLSSHTFSARIGVLYRRIRARTSRRRGKAPSTEDPGVYAKFLEFGTKNMAARPFMRPAFDTKAEEAIEAFTQELKEELDKV